MARQPNILFLLSDEHCFRHLSARPAAEGGEAVRTPTLDALIAQGAWFDRAYCQMPLCTPSRMCFMAGLEQEQCGAWNNNSVLDERFPTIGQTFGEQGYATCLVGKLHFGGRRQKAGFAHRPMATRRPVRTSPTRFRPGLRRQRDALPHPRGWAEPDPRKPAAERMVVDEAVPGFASRPPPTPTSPGCLCFVQPPPLPLTAPRRHLDRYLGRVAPPRVGRSGDSALHPMTIGMATGFQVDAIDDDEMMLARAAYFACVDTLDEILGDFLAILDRDGLLDDTILVYTSDHGELCGEHGLWWKNSWHEAAARVPFIISTPQHRTGELPASRPDLPVSLGDLFPTLCGLAGVGGPDRLCGTDLSAAVLGGALPARRGPCCARTSARAGAPGPSSARCSMARTSTSRSAAATPDVRSERGSLGAGHLAASHPEAGRLRALALAGFSFEQAEADRLRDTAGAKAAHAALPKCRTPNQILLGDGRLVECDTVLYDPVLITAEVDKEYQ